MNDISVYSITIPKLREHHRIVNKSYPHQQSSFCHTYAEICVNGRTNCLDRLWASLCTCASREAHF